MSSEGRQTHFNAFVGAPGSGKSRCLSELLQGYKRNVLVYKEHINIDDEALRWLPVVDYKKYQGGKAKISSMNIGYEPFLNWVYKNYRNGALLIDDASIYEINQISKPLNRLLAMRRHLSIDVYLVYHGFTGFPIDQFKFLNYVVLFNTSDEFKYKRNKIAKADAISEAKARIDARQHILPPGIKGVHKYTPEIIKMR